MLIKKVLLKIIGACFLFLFLLDIFLPLEPVLFFLILLISLYAIPASLVLLIVITLFSFQKNKNIIEHADSVFEKIIDSIVKIFLVVLTVIAFWLIYQMRRIYITPSLTSFILPAMLVVALVVVVLFPPQRYKNLRLSSRIPKIIDTIVKIFLVALTAVTSWIIFYIFIIVRYV